MLKVSGACKTAANVGISVIELFPAFQDIYSGCCTKLLVRKALIARLWPVVVEFLHGGIATKEDRAEVAIDLDFGLRVLVFPLLEEGKPRGWLSVSM